MSASYALQPAESPKLPIDYGIKSNQKVNSDLAKE